MSALTPAALPGRAAPPGALDRRTTRDALLVTLAGQVERIVGIVTALALRRLLDPGRLGVYTGLRLLLDNTNRSSLGVGLGAVQEIPALRAAGRFEEARHAANVAHTVNTVTCVLYALALLMLAAWRHRAGAGTPFADEWVGGLAAVAGLVLLKRYESFLIAVLRAHREFALTARVDVLESFVSAVAVVAGLWLAGFWGLLASVAIILGAKIAYLHARHPLRFAWEWDARAAWGLMKRGLPILANTAAFGCVLGLDRAFILARLPDGERAAGLYSVAVLASGWCLDVAGRIVLVLSTTFRDTFGRSDDAGAVARQAARATEVLAAVVAPLAAGAYLIGPDTMGILLPRYAGGLPAIRALLPGVVMFSLVGPVRQMLIAVDRPYRLLFATLAALATCAASVALGASAGGLAGIAGGMSVGGLMMLVLTGAIAFVPSLGPHGWLVHVARLARVLAWHATGAILATHLPLVDSPGWLSWCVRLTLLAAWCGPPLAYELRRSGLLASRCFPTSLSTAT